MTEYTPPNVTVSELIERSVAPLIAVPALIALIGPTSGAITISREVTLTAEADGEDIVQIPSDIPIPSGSQLIEVTKVADIDSRIDGVYVDGDDYEINLSNATITRIGDSAGLPNGVTNYNFQGTAPNYERTVVVTFKYVPSNYFDPILMNNMPDITNRFGPALNANNEIVSPVTMAALAAFENGASQIVIQPLFGFSDTVKRQVTASEVADPEIWESCLEGLQLVPEVNVLVPVVGQSSEVSTEEVSAIFLKVQDHIRGMRVNEQEYGIAIMGNDSSVQQVSRADVLDQAADLRERFEQDTAQQTVLVSPSRFVRRVRNSSVIVGGQYVAAALAGMISSRSVSTPLTRRNIAGFTDVAELRSKSEKNQDAGAGLTVIETVGGRVRVRHAITMDDSSTTLRELSIVRAKHRVIESVRRTIDTQIIGQVIADGDAPTVVSAAIIGVLDQLRQEQDIVSYTGVQSRTKSLDPTTIEVRFSYRPAFPVNYVDVVFSLDLTDNTVQLQG